MTARVYGAVYAFLAERFGGSVRSEKTTQTVDTTRSVVAQRDPERVSITFVNLSADAIYVVPGPDVTTTHGIRLDSLGGFLSLNVREDMILPSDEWTAVAAVAGSSLLVITVRRETELGELPELIPATPQPLAPEVGPPRVRPGNIGGPPIGIQPGVGRPTPIGPEPTRIPPSGPQRPGRPSR